MSSYIIKLKLAVAVVLMLCAGAAVADNSVSTAYASRSVMNTGLWVKIGVEDSGVYEISYSSLREMGFSNPAKVGVFGRGGVMLPLSFTDEEGNPLYDDDLSQIPVSHYDNKLYFYANGVENITFSPAYDETCGGHFVNGGLNLYSTRGYYFLSETDDLNVIKNFPSINALESIDSGVGYVYHEQDLFHNDSNTGQLYWGEKFNGTESGYKSWNIELPGLSKSKSSVMNCAFISEREVTGATLSYGVEGGSKNISFSTFDKPTIYFHYQSPEYGDISITTDRAKAFVKYDKGDNANGTANLDYWIITYPKDIPTLQMSDGTTLPQDRIWFSSLMPGQSGEVALKDCLSLEVWNISDRENPVKMPVRMDGRNGTFTIKRYEDVPGVVIFDKTRTQKQITGYEKGYEVLGNQNLHGYGAEGAELAIITLPWLKDATEKLADLHRQKDGINVVVVTADEVYNEFSGGMPDPMAYRNFARMLYNSPGRQLKNLLLIGPLYGDFRGMRVPKDPKKGLIAYQTPRVNVEKGGMNANDIYGMLDNISETDVVEKQTMHVGVGVLPCYFESELINYTAKVKKYLEDESFANRVNSTLAIGGVANNHVHDNQAIEAGDLLNRHNFNAGINSKLIINAYGNEGARNKLFESFHQGKNFVIYYGHGAPTYLGLDKLFFTGAHISRFRNNQLPFMAFAGCLLSNIDRGQRGLGESIVLDTGYGAIGALLATRDTWSGQNKELMTQLINSFYRQNPNTITSVRHEEKMTIGEIVSRAKNVGTFENELAYQLVCDPAIVVPVANRKMNVSMSGIKTIPGQKIILTGSVLEYDERTVDETFNGEIVVRLMEPPVTYVSEDLVMEEDSELEVEYSDIQAAMAVGKVENGNFAVTMHIPSGLSRWEKERVTFNFAAYDPVQKMGAASMKTSVVQSVPSSLIPKPDLVPPTIDELYFDQENCELVVTVLDDVALDTSLSPTTVKSGFRLYVDDKFIGRASDVPAQLYPGKAMQTRAIPMSGISYGKHVAKVIASDLGGNITTRMLTFNYEPYSGKFSLAMNRAAVLDEVEFSISGHLPAEAVLYVVDSTGKEVYSAPMKDGRHEWNRCSASGSRLPAGLYKAFIRESGDYSVKGHSDPIPVPLL